MIYIDTSSLLKLFLPDNHSEEVGLAISVESVVIVSALTELEAYVQIKAPHLGGSFSEAASVRIRSRMAQSLTDRPFLRRKLDGSVFKTALGQHEAAASHCRSLDRLHLAAMQELGATRLMTHALRQAAAAREIGYEVVSPGI
jgi:predicted nucleic acid-binding protein